MKCVIVCGADILDYKKMASYVDAEDFVIYCDSGLKHMNSLGIKPSLIVGDFDSHENPNMSVETIVLPVEKDDTDSVYALKEGIKGHEGLPQANGKPYALPRITTKL